MSWGQTRVENKLKITLDTAKWLSKNFNLIHSHLAVKGGNHIMTNLETTQKINANKIFTCTRREFTPDFKAMVVKEYEAGATRKELARKYDILPHYINRWQQRVQKVTQSINEETKRYKAQIIEKHQKEIDKKVEEQNIQQELQALRAENKALKTLLKVYMK
jgi:transposase-like protein